MIYCVNCGKMREKTSTLKAYSLAQLMPYESLLCHLCSLTQFDNTKALFECTLSDKVVPKSRPRVTKNATFYPAKYTAWRSDARTEITLAILEKFRTEGRTTEDLLPFDKDNPVAMFVDFYGSLRGSSDLDNAIGSILDVLAFNGWCLSNDTLQRVPLIYARFHALPKATKKAPKIIRTEIRVYSVPSDLISEPPKVTKPPSNKPCSLSQNNFSQTP